MSRFEPAGIPLTARPPLYQFTRNYGHVFSNSGVFLLDYGGQPHWFATDGYSAMLTPALSHEPGTGDGLLMPPRVGPHRCYRTDHIKTLFKYVKGKRIIWEQGTGTLYSPDGVVQVPAYQRPTEAGEEPEPVELPDIRQPFEGVPTEQDGWHFDLKLVSAIRGAFSQHDKDAEIIMTFLDGARVRLEISAPYAAEIVLAGSGETLQPLPGEEGDTPA